MSSQGGLLLSGRIYATLPGILLIPEEDRVVVTLSFFYMEWFKREYPEHKLDDPSGKYVLQA